MNSAPFVRPRLVWVLDVAEICDFVAEGEKDPRRLHGFCPWAFPAADDCAGLAVMALPSTGFLLHLGDLLGATVILLRRRRQMLYLALL